MGSYPLLKAAVVNHALTLLLSPSSPEGILPSRVVWGLQTRTL